MRISAVSLLGLFATRVGAAAASGGFPTGIPFAPRGGAAAAAASAATASKAKKSSKAATAPTATTAAAAAASAVASSSFNKKSSNAPLSQAAELTPEDEPLLRDIAMLSDMLEEVVKKDDPEADALYRKFRGLGLDR